MKLEKVKINKSTFSGSDWDVLSRNVEVWAGPNGELRMQVGLPTGNGSSFFSFHFTREEARALVRVVDDSFEAQQRALRRSQDKLTARIEKLEEEAKAKHFEELL